MRALYFLEKWDGVLLFFGIIYFMKLTLRKADNRDEIYPHLINYIAPVIIMLLSILYFFRAADSSFISHLFLKLLSVGSGKL